MKNRKKLFRKSFRRQFEMLTHSQKCACEWRAFDMICSRTKLIECDGYRMCYTNTKITGIVARLPGGRAVPIADLMRDYRVIMPRSMRNS